MTFTTGDGSAADLAVTTESPETQPGSSPAGSTSRGRARCEYVEFLRPPDEPVSQLPGVEADGNLGGEAMPGDTAEDVSESGVNPPIVIEGPAGPAPTPPEHNRLASTTLTSILPPGMPGPQDPLDITGLAGPIEPEIETDIVGNTA